MVLWVGREPYCDYATLREAVEEAERRAPDVPETICLLPGIYREQVTIYRSHLSIIGIGQVEIAMDRHAREPDGKGGEIGTFATPTLFLGGSDLRIANITVSNTSGQGAEIGQAIALTAHCDRTVFRGCTFRGYQDTLFTGPLPPSPKKGGGTSFGGVEIRQTHDRYRQLYMNCRIEGTVDYIFGGASACFEHCELRSRLRAGDEPFGYVTAASTPRDQAWGYVFFECLLTAEPAVPAGSVYLGRPWREYARTVFAGCRMGDHIHPSGWHDWNQPANRQTADYREYEAAAAALPAARADWAVSRPNGAEAWNKKSLFPDDPFWA
ncbi:pectinesterase family protein [Saccharibacillus deserti]|uniref:pectinesterase family protein n=1 Tax=Saccharibacillus deserti TaxID=1634444 RepID=UPI0015532970|nr:pectinesterase family protein [Saccharibacillus deserti]